MIVINDSAKELVAKVIKKAEENVISLEEMKEIRNGENPQAADRPGLSCNLPGNHLCIFSIEHHPKADDLGTIPCRHLSVSTQQKGKWPLPKDVEIIMHAFGFRGAVKQCGVYTETSPVESVNLIQTISDPDSIDPAEDKAEDPAEDKAEDKAEDPAEDKAEDPAEDKAEDKA